MRLSVGSHALRVSPRERIALADVYSSRYVDCEVVWVGHPARQQRSD
jgi:hypothetical protein